MHRRRALFLLLPALAASHAGARSPPAIGFGPLSLGMAKADAVRALGPGLLITPLCQGVEGALFDWAVPALAPVAGRRVPAMVMFGGAAGAVSEIEATSAQPEARLDAAAWQALLQRQAQAAAAGAGRFAEVERAQHELGSTALWRLDHASGTLTMAARWMRASGACHTRLHWLAKGARAVI